MAHSGIVRARTEEKQTEKHLFFQVLIGLVKFAVDFIFGRPVILIEHISAR